MIINKRLNLTVKKKGVQFKLKIPLLSDVKTLTAGPLVGVAGCFANKDCRGIKVTK